MINTDSDYECLFNNTDLGIIFRNSEGKVSNANPAALKIFGIDSEFIDDLQDASLRSCIFKEDGSEFLPDKYPPDKVLKTGKPVRECIAQFREKDATTQWLSITSNPQFRKNEKEPYSVFSTFLDISERILAVRTSNEAKKLMQLVINNIPQHIFWKDINSVYQGCNINFAKAS